MAAYGRTAVNFKVRLGIRVVLVAELRVACFYFFRRMLSG
ncbi:hypothetical protein SAMN04487941_3359 [Pontibacter akesuensis]|uniref:Uncharacterized protein n=1 Tax=Pontibacter akesuensis TaxID=388950 RepID=A0A1I7K3T4_9BACT|nr:hypothetical protein SAMN04487941_3359 [Pontibacter akesuensis]